LDLLFNCGHESVHILAGKSLCRVGSDSGGPEAVLQPAASPVITAQRRGSWPGFLNETAQ
jgi:hypothetical protein